jgi:hypothetical protein
MVDPARDLPKSPKLTENQASFCMNGSCDILPGFDLLLGIDAYSSIRHNGVSMFTKPYLARMLYQLPLEQRMWPQ